MKTVKEVVKEITVIDVYGFQDRPLCYWLPESREAEVKRKQLNLAIFHELIKAGWKFPANINERRAQEYQQLRAIQ